MIGILSLSRDVYFNLAVEEYLLKQKTDDIFMLWQSETSVVVGKHQNTFAEVNHAYIREHQIPVARRLSGGGTVFHGPGNLNFTFIMNGEPGKMVNFRKFVTPVIEYLKTLGLSAEIGTQNEILIGGVKISGNAEHIFKKRVLHHGTLLFNANLKILEEAIKVVPERYIGKAVQSNRSTVGNISSYLNSPLILKDLTMGLFQFLRDYYKVKNTYNFSRQELDAIEHLRNNKYITTAWIYHYSPPFEVKREIRINGQLITISLKVDKGIITDATLNSIPMSDWKDLLVKLIHNPYEYNQIELVLKASGLFSDDQVMAILKALF